QSRKRGRDDEGNGILGFLQDSALIEVVDDSDLEEDVAPLKWEATIFSTSRISTSDTSFVADLPRRPGHVAVRSASKKGKGDLVMVITEAHYHHAVELYLGPYGLSATDGIESDPHEGVLTGRKGRPSFQYASTDDAIRAILETKQPYVDALHKFLALSSFLHWQTTERQANVDAKMEATFTEAELSKHSSLFVDKKGNALPKIGVRVAHDIGGGANVDYSTRGFESDPKSLLTFGGGTIGGAQNGARKLVALDSEEDFRLKTPGVAATTVDHTTMFLRLNDAAVFAARSETLFDNGSWLNKNVVGLAWVRRRGLSLVRTRERTTRGGEPWVYLVTVIDNWEHCWSGPGFVLFVTQQGCFSGYKNLKEHDKEGARQMEVGRSGDFSTPAAKAIATLRAGTVKHAAHQRTIDSGRTALRGNVNYTAEERGAEKSTNERKGEGANSCHEDGCSCETAGEGCTCVNHVHVKNSSVGGELVLV
ncbi:unnamed protein product, partial [Ectocarpus sp. 6 AP-2014]